MSPSHPAIAWKKNSQGINPRKYKFPWPWAEIVLVEVWKHPVMKSKWDMFPLYTLLSDAYGHFRDVDIGTF